MQARFHEITDNTTAQLVPSPQHHFAQKFIRLTSQIYSLSHTCSKCPPVALAQNSQPRVSASPTATSPDTTPRVKPCSCRWVEAFRSLKALSDNSYNEHAQTDHGDHTAVMLGGAAAQNIFYSSNTNPIDLNGNKDLEFIKKNVSPSQTPGHLRKALCL